MTHTMDPQVFCDNYLDGGYHVPIAHPGLASGLDLTGYRNELHGRVSLQVGSGMTVVRLVIPGSLQLQRSAATRLHCLPQVPA